MPKAPVQPVNAKPVCADPDLAEAIRRNDGDKAEAHILNLSETRLLTAIVAANDWANAGPGNLLRIRSANLRTTLIDRLFEKSPTAAVAADVLSALTAANNTPSKHAAHDNLARHIERFSEKDLQQAQRAVTMAETINARHPRISDEVSTVIRQSPFYGRETGLDILQLSQGVAVSALQAVKPPQGSPEEMATMLKWLGRFVDFKTAEPRAARDMAVATQVIAVFSGRENGELYRQADIEIGILDNSVDPAVSLRKKLAASTPHRTRKPPTLH